VNPSLAAGLSAVVLDIEGTTTPVEFVHSVLFPYARARVRSFLADHAALEPVQADLERLRQEHAAEVAPGPPPWPEQPPAARLEGAVAYAHWLMDRDRKSTGLKALQGRIWEAGYLSGELKGQVYGDVPAAFARLAAGGRRLAIFSSGSVLAQRLLFRHSTAGDLSGFIHAYFDTTTGPKQEAASYAKIAGALGRPAAEVLFVTDTPGEADAARGAGLQTALCARGERREPGPHPIIGSLGELA
jgi:enolase-phosphatase E1